MTRAADSTWLRDGLADIVGRGHVLEAVDSRRYEHDATLTRGLAAKPDAVVRPGSAGEVAAVLRWCYQHDVAIVPRGGGTGMAGGAVPIGGGVVCSTERLTAIREFEPTLWRAYVEAGVTTHHLRRLARENGLFFPPDPGASEDSQIGGNVATNAGGPHAFKYGSTGNWVTGLEVAVPPGELLTVGGAFRKDVAGYDLKNLIVGSEGTLGIITAVRLRLLPVPESALPVIAFFPSAVEGCAAIRDVLGHGLQVSALDYVDGQVLGIVSGAYPGKLPEGAGFALLMEVDGTSNEAAAARDELVELLSEVALGVDGPSIRSLWRWRDGISGAVTTVRGGKVSEDVVVPLDRLEEALSGIAAIGAQHALLTCSWGHAGDGNIHATFVVDPEVERELRAAEEATRDLFALAVSMGGSITGEHGVGWIKRGQLEHQWSERALSLHEQIKRSFDPKGLMNPGKKVARAPLEGAAGASG